jgi:hypothetical protein
MGQEARVVKTSKGGQKTYSGWWRIGIEHLESDCALLNASGRWPDLEFSVESRYRYGAQNFVAIPQRDVLALVGNRCPNCGALTMYMEECCLGDERQWLPGYVCKQCPRSFDNAAGVREIDDSLRARIIEEIKLHYSELECLESHIAMMMDEARPELACGDRAEVAARRERLVVLESLLGECGDGAIEWKWRQR